MNTIDIPQQIAKTLRINLVLEDAPAFGAGSMPAQEEPLFVMLAHLFPLIVWPWKRKTSPAVDAHGKEALNFAITAMLILWPVGIVSSFFGVTIARIAALGTSVLCLGLLALVVFAMFQARHGKLLRYPVNFRFIK